MVKFSRNKVTFPARIRPQLLDELIPLVWQIDGIVAEPVIFDFSECEEAFANAMVPIISIAQFLRSGGTLIDYVQPIKPDARKFFLTTRWEQLLRGDSSLSAPEPGTAYLPCQQYVDEKELRRILDSLRECIASNVVLPSSSMVALQWAMSEVADNVLNHSRSTTGGLIQVATTPSRVSFCVADNGHGLYPDLRWVYPSIVRDDATAIQHAVRRGVSRNIDENRGRGLTGSQRVALMSGGQFSIRSRCASVVWRGVHGAPGVHVSHDPFPGTVVDVQIMTDSAFDVAAAIGDGDIGYTPLNYFEERYLADDLSHYVFPMKQEAFGTWSRRQGRIARTRVLNLLAVVPPKPIVVDWNSVEAASSGFIDEAFGILASKIGLETYNSSIIHANTSPFIRSLISTIVSSRTSSGY